MSDQPNHTPIHVEIHAAQTIDDSSWLQQDRFKWFRDAYSYASTQTHAIMALSKCHPTELFHAVVAILRGAQRNGHIIETMLGQRTEGSLARFRDIEAKAWPVVEERPDPTAGCCASCGVDAGSIDELYKALHRK